MKAKITNVTKNIADTQNPQVDIEVVYEDIRFPITHQHTDGGKRKFIYTLPYEKYSILDENKLKSMIVAQGIGFIESLNGEIQESEQDKLDNTQTTVESLSNLIDTEITI